MSSPGTVSIDWLGERVGQEIGVSGWRCVDQASIDRFAEATSDHQFIHVDPERAAREAPFGATVAHGFLTVSLLSALAYEALPEIEGRLMGINYGFDRLRFIEPVRAGSRVRARFRLDAVEERRPAEWLLTYRVSVDIEGAERLALVADWLTIAAIG